MFHQQIIVDKEMFLMNREENKTLPFTLFELFLNCFTDCVKLSLQM